MVNRVSFISSLWCFSKYFLVVCTNTSTWSHQCVAEDDTDRSGKEKRQVGRSADFTGIFQVLVTFREKNLTFFAVILLHTEQRRNKRVCTKSTSYVSGLGLGVGRKWVERDQTTRQWVVCSTQEVKIWVLHLQWPHSKVPQNSLGTQGNAYLWLHRPETHLRISPLGLLWEDSQLCGQKIMPCYLMEALLFDGRNWKKL